MNIFLNFILQGVQGQHRIYGRRAASHLYKRIEIKNTPILRIKPRIARKSTDFWINLPDLDRKGQELANPPCQVCLIL